MDYKTDVALRKALKEETAGSTVLIVAQRISTIRHADKIVVLSGGKVAEEGTPEELLAKKGMYARMVKLQTESQGWTL